MQSRRVMGRHVLAVMIAVATTACGAANDHTPDEPAPPPMEEPAPPLAPIPAAETGFVDVPPQAKGDPASGRMFYSFRAADERPEEKPLLVVFNGGPGDATSSLLTILGTGPYRVEFPTATTYRVSENAGSLTRFANVLWIDERNTGFSYATEEKTTSCVFDYAGDAEDYLRVVLSFVEAHPRLAAAKLGIVGESYGGVRASLMVYELVHDEAIRERVTTWLGVVPTKDSVAEKVMGVAYIQPLLLGAAQLDAQDAEAKAMRGTDPDVNPYDIRTKMTAIADPSTFVSPLDLALRDVSTQLFGVDLASTPRIGPADRKSAFRVATTDDYFTEKVFGDALAERLGALRKGDRYYDQFAQRCVVDPTHVAVDPKWFEETLATVPIFMTDAKYDSVIRTHVVFDVLAQRGHAIDATSRPGYVLVDGRPVRFPSYEAGHIVPAAQPEAFSADVRAWLASGGR